MENKFYIYVYLDPRTIGEFTYGEYKFNYQPFYVGKGKSDRDQHHIRESRIKFDTNKIKTKIIRSLQKDNLNPIIIKLYEDLTEELSYKMEKILIDIIGKKIDGKGPLTNIKDGGDGFTSEDSKKTWLLEGVREKRIDGLKKWWDNLDYEKKIKYSEDKKGKNNPFFNKKHTDQYKKIRSEKYKGEGNPMFGKTGINSHHYGKKHSSETIDKKSKSMKKFYSGLSKEKREEIGKKISNSNKNNPKMRGENNGNSKLIKNDVINIRKFYELNSNQGHTKTIKQIMKLYNMGYTAIDSIIKYKTWRV